MKFPKSKFPAYLNALIDVASTKLPECIKIEKNEYEFVDNDECNNQDLNVDIEFLEQFINKMKNDYNVDFEQAKQYVDELIEEGVLEKTEEAENVELDERAAYTILLEVAATYLNIMINELRKGENNE